MIDVRGGDGGGGGFVGLETDADVDGSADGMAAALDAGGEGLEGADVVGFEAEEVVDFNVPFAATSCSILLLEGFTGVGFAVFVPVFFAVATGFSVAVAFAFVAFAGDFTAFFFVSSSPLTAFAAFVDAFLVPPAAFDTSSLIFTSSTTFLGRPRPRLGITSAVDIIRVQLRIRVYVFND